MDWRDIPSAPGYQASRCGQVRQANTGELVAQWMQAKGYAAVYYKGRGGKCTRALVRRLIADAWHGPLEPGQRIRSLDQDPGNNCANNIQVILPATTCRRGHPRNPKNTRISVDGWPVCRVCAAMASKTPTRRRACRARAPARNKRRREAAAAEFESAMSTWPRERWRTCKQYPGYMVSSSARVRDKSTGGLVPLHPNGRTVWLRVGQHTKSSVEVLVLLRAAFPKPPGPRENYCTHNHLWSPDNTYIRPRSGRRVCRTCWKQRHLRHAEKLKEWKEKQNAKKYKHVYR